MSEASSLDSIFLAAVQIKSAEERRAYLDQACSGDAALCQQVERLLAAHESMALAFLQDTGESRGSPAEEAERGGAFDDHRTDHSPPPNSDLQATDLSPHITAGAMIAGRYKLREVVGEGGMGTVWMAQQTEPVKRLVALKLIKPGMDSRTVLARFNAERQALAVIEHPNIAKVLDGGTTDAGRPYFVMELVRGMPLTEYCDTRRLTVGERLELFVQVCSAVQHAHHKAIIHRDLKPSNVLSLSTTGGLCPR